MWFSLGQLRTRCAPMDDSIDGDVAGARRGDPLRRPLSRRTSAAVILLSTAFMAGGAWWFALREPPVVRIGPPSTPLGLRIGGRLPALKAEGWLNGPLKVRDQLGKIVVVDLWTDSCGVYCDAMPQLRAVAAKYDDNPDVVFVGLTPLTKELAEQFTRDADIHWSNGYGVEALEPFRPTIAVLGRDGRIVWEDLRSRMIHSADKLAHDLNAAIIRAIEQPGIMPDSPGRPESHSAARAGG